jgi:hypothetical protein
MQTSARNRIIWAVGTAIALCLCFLLVRFIFWELHGSFQYPLILLIAGLIAAIIAAIFDWRKIMISTVGGYIGGFALAMLFNTDGVDPGGARTNNWWIIWTVSFVILFLAGVIWEVIGRCRKKQIRR